MAAKDKHYSATLEAGLRLHLKAETWDGLLAYLDGLSNAQFRTAGYMLGETLANELDDNRFWQLSETLVLHNAKAFLITMLKSAVERGFSVEDSGFVSLCGTLRQNETDVHNAQLRIVQQMQRPDDVERLITQFGVEDDEKRLAYLLKEGSLPASFVLLKTLKRLEHNRDLLVRTVRFFMKRGDSRAFNLASLLKTYWGLTEVEGTFARTVQPYQLAHIEGNYEAFCDALNR